MNNEKYKFIVVDSDSYASRLMFHDLMNVENIYETSKMYEISNPILSFFNRIHLSLNLNRIINIPFKDIWNRYCILERYKEYNGIKVIILTNVSLQKISLKYLQKMRNLYNYKIVLVIVDSCLDKLLSPLPYLKKIKFDLVYSFDMNDCLNYGFRYTTNLYSKINDVKPSSKESDLFFIGRAKDRLGILQKIVNQCNKRKLITNFYVLNAEKKKAIKINGITYLKKIMPYSEVLPQIISSKCLLDIVQKGQNGLTMRVFEAIFYNKKLITNNKNIKNLKFYNADYMQIINAIDDIDLDWLHKDIKVDYGYNGDYSPLYFIEQVKNDLL